VTQVTRKPRTILLCLTAWIALSSAFVFGQSSPDSVVGESPEKKDSAGVAKPAENLYLKLRGVGLDPERTYRIRGASLDRPALHIMLEDGEISFTADVGGRITGAFFEGDGELLLTPPNQVERASMALFTGMAILEERFSSAYLRFNDDTFSELQPFLRPADDAREFSTKRNEPAINMAEQDALRLLATFSRGLPVTGAPSSADSMRVPATDRMLHARVQGQKLGTFDVYFDTAGLEEVWAGQPRTVEGSTYYDLWTSFTPEKTSPAPANKKGKDKPEDISIPRYRIKVEVNPPTTVRAEAWLQMDVLESGERTLFFELSRFLQVKAVEVGGRPVEFINNTAIDGTQLAKRGNDLVAVVFPEPLRRGQKLELKFVYGGDVLSEAGGGLLYVGARGTWYPNRGLLRANFDLEFHYPPGWTLIATGKRITSEAAGSDGSAESSSGEEQVARWVTERPTALSGFNLGRYARAAAQAGNVTVAAYAARAMEKSFPRPAESVITPPIRRPGASADVVVVEAPVPSPARNAQIVADNGARAVEFFSQRFGAYPYSSLALTQMPGRVSQGWPGLVFLSSYAFLTPEETVDLGASPVNGALNRLTLPHETAHQWWGDLIGWRTYRDQWVFEALANYSSLLMMETEKPTEVRLILERYREDLLQKNKYGESLRDAGPVSLGLRLNSSHFPSGYEGVSYGRGTWLFHMLRHMLLDAEAMQTRRSQETQPVADEPFIRALRKIRERYADKAISTRELFAVFDEELPRALWYEGHKSLDWFVQGWVEGVALPHFSTQSVRIVKKAGGTEVVGIVRQSDAPQDLVSAVSVYAVTATKPRLIGIVLADGPETPFHLAVPEGTKRITLDAYQNLLSSPK